MTQYGTLRTWSAVLRFVGAIGVLFAIVGWIVWIFEVEGFWATLGVIFFGAPILIFIATLPIALGQAMRSLADIGDAVRGPIE